MPMTRDAAEYIVAEALQTVTAQLTPAEIKKIAKRHGGEPAKGKRGIYVFRDAKLWSDFADEVKEGGGWSAILDKIDYAPDGQSLYLMKVQKAAGIEKVEKMVDQMHKLEEQGDKLKHRIWDIQNKWEKLKDRVAAAGGHPDVDPDTEWGDMMA